MQRFVVFALLIALSLSQLTSVKDWHSQTEDIKVYRQLLKTENEKKIQLHNNKPNTTFRLKNYVQFGYFTKQERHQLFLIKSGQIKHNLKQSTPIKSNGFFNFQVNKKRINWTEKGKVSSVKQQGFCGSCYAYAAVADIESSYLFKGLNLDLSQQQIIDCSLLFNNYGCQGGWMSGVFLYAMIRGLQTNQKYPDNELSQQWGLPGDCLTQRGQHHIKRFSYTSYRIYDCLALTQMLEKRPVTVALSVNQAFFFYQNGILNQCDQEVNHGAQLTGYLHDGEDNYWILKNSWGTQWGEQGYIRIDRSQKNGNMCQICYAPSYSII